MCINHEDYLGIYSASIKVTPDYGKWQDLSKSHPEDGLNGCVLGGWLLPTEDILKILHSVTPMVPTPPCCLPKLISDIL